MDEEMRKEMQKRRHQYGVKANIGDEVMFMGEGGFDIQLENALKVLTKGEIYKLSDLFIDDWGVSFYLEGIPRKSFPEDMFMRL